METILFFQLSDSCDQLYNKIEHRFGVLPNFFKLPPDNPEITENLWGFALFAYLDNPLPSLFKERLFVYLSAFCKVKYGITPHLGFLIGLGNAAGDRAVPPQSIKEAIKLLERKLPSEDEMEGPVQKLEAVKKPLAKLPEAGLELEEAVFACATHVFLQTSAASKCLGALRHILKEPQFQ